MGERAVRGASVGEELRRKTLRMTEQESNADIHERMRREMMRQK